ncbi:hypothetical protein LTR84_006474 [Exophiala bonariae]|uniref:Zn(2)-C6 fungal-type domain-containing protein n=1 Tax=Exophiala bonariae TaxID=1690606 RepID=A0AAV9N439_9EURO|nr:hypothetical protein LTR84_006474 [Exophiala bonariae]
MFQFTGGPEAKTETSVRRHSTNLSSKTDKRQITRNRTSYSCITCRRRKVKCDKVHPVCGGCTKANEECLYTLQENQESNGISEASKASDVADLKKRKIESARDGSDTSPVNEHASSSSVSPTHLRAIEDQLHRLSALVDSLRSNGSTDEHLYLRNLLTPIASGSDHDTEDGHSLHNLSLGMFSSARNGSNKDATELSRPLASLKLGHNEVTSPEDSFWKHITSEINQLNQAMRRQSDRYVSATSIQTESCPSRAPETLEHKHHRSHDKDGSLDARSFQQEAGIEIPKFYDPTNSCPVCHLMPFTKSTLLQDIPIRCTPAVGKEHLLKHVPSSAQSNVLFRSWLSGVHPILPILIPTEIQKIHEKFWLQYEPNSAKSSWFPDLGSTALMYAIWYAGSLSLPLEGFRRWFPGVTRAMVCARFHDQVVFALHLAQFSRNTTLQTLAAFVMICSLPISEEDPTQATLYLQLVVRLSLTMGLHREPTLFNMSVAEEGMRRRLWWHVIQLDVSQVVSSGYPSLIADAFCDTRIICEDHDALTDRNTPDGDSQTNSQQRSSNGASPTMHGPTWESYRTFSHVARAKSILSCAFREVVSIHMSAKALNNADMLDMKRTMTAAGEQVNYIIQQIPSKGVPELGFTPSLPKQKQQRTLDCETSMGDPISLGELAHFTDLAGDPDISSSTTYYYRSRRVAYNKFARITLSMMNDKVHCVAYAPFLKNAKSKLWNVGRQCALHNCHSFLRKFISIASDPELEPFWWSWPSMYGPMHAALIVLVDLYERPRSVEAPRSRELIDTVFAYSSPERGIVGGPYGVTIHRPMREGGVEAWEMLRGLRSAAWQKAGLDPRFLWTEADEVDIGFAKPLTDSQKIAQSIREDTLYENHRDHGRRNGNDQTSSTEKQSFEDGFQYAFKLSQAELLGSADGCEGHECGKTLRDRFINEIENNERLNPNRGLAWRSNQQKMPFPLSEKMEACSGSAAQSGQDASHVLELNSHYPRTGTQHPSCTVQLSTPWINPDGADGGRQTLRESSSGENNMSRAPVSSVEHQTLQKGANGHAEVSAINSGTWSNGVPHDIHTGINEQNHQSNGQPVGNGVSSDPYLHKENPPTDTDLGFDWDRWDSVFGQYSGFTDMMEDVRWHDYLEE